VQAPSTAEYREKINANRSLSDGETAVSRSQFVENLLPDIDELTSRTFQAKYQAVRLIMDVRMLSTSEARKSQKSLATMEIGRWVGVSIDRLF